MHVKILPAQNQISQTNQLVIDNGRSRLRLAHYDHQPINQCIFINNLVGIHEKTHVTEMLYCFIRTFSYVERGCEEEHGLQRISFTHPL